MAIQYKTALVIGGSRGVGRDLSIKLAQQGVNTVAIARTQKHLDALKADNATVQTLALDASADGTARQLIADYAPDLIILAGGKQPDMGALSDLSWEEFSAAWNTDTKIAFEFVTAALKAPLAKGSAIVSFASGAALAGSPMSGGYAGAKRMQHYISNYGSWESDRDDRDLRFYTIYPKQLIVGSGIAGDAAGAYAKARSIEPEQFMSQWEKPLTPELIGDHVMGLLEDQTGSNTGTYGITGTGMEQMK
ncbi:MAG: SDR family oxidoreductase [Cohaesibacteraceae bacterium]|nr:SDR family oxidoreductase [Cohaesibacteraceae bacterium]